MSFYDDQYAGGPNSLVHTIGPGGTLTQMRRRDVMPTSIGEGMEALGEALGGIMRNRRNKFPAAPMAPASQFPTAPAPPSNNVEMVASAMVGPSPAQYQPGFDGRSQMGAAPRWQSTARDAPGFPLGGLLGTVFGRGTSGGGLY